MYAGDIYSEPANFAGHCLVARPAYRIRGAGGALRSVRDGIRGSGWGSGGGGDAMGATLVSAVPLPANPLRQRMCWATESKGLSKSQPRSRKRSRMHSHSDKNTKTKIEARAVKTATQRKLNPNSRVESNSYGEGGPVSAPTP